MKCYRCQSELECTNPDDDRDIRFYLCTGCKFRYAKKSGQDIHDAWMTPLTFPLHAVLYEEEPESKSEVVARNMFEREGLDKKFMLDVILDELDNPKQKVSEVLNFSYPNEEKLRGFLASTHRHLLELCQNV